MFLLVSAGLEPRDLKLAGIVLQHSRYNRNEFRLLPGLDLGQADILLVNPLHPAGLQAILAAGAAGRRIVTVSALPPDVQPTGRHSIALHQLTVQLLPVLNQVVQAEVLDAASPGSRSRQAPSRKPSLVPASAVASLASIDTAGLPDTAVDECSPVECPGPENVVAGSPELAAEMAAASAIATAARRAPGEDGLHAGSQECQPWIGQFHQAPPRARLQVVVADPSVPAQQQLARALRRMGLAVHCVAGAADALRRLTAQHTDLVITESGLVDGDGFDLIRSLRAQPGYRYTPVLLLRSRLHPMDATRARLAGDVVLLTKPLTRQALETVVRQALRASAVLDDLNELLAPG